MTSIFENFEKQCESACASLLSDPNFQGEFNVLGLSQGGLIARYIVEECNTNVPVRNMVTLGGPHKGVAATPGCSDGIFCDIINMIVDEFVYFKDIQEFIGPAGYFRDPTQLDRYLEDSVFLPYVNNEKDKSATYESRFEKLNGAMLVMFSGDTVVFPKESEWFWELQADGTVTNVLDTDFYKSDYIGLKKLNEAGKVKFIEWPGEHLQFTMEQVDLVVVPFLMS